MKRTRKEQKRDSQKHYGGLAELPADKKAQDIFKRPAYQSGKLVDEQGRQMERKTLLEYLAERYDIKKGVGSGGH